AYRGFEENPPAAARKQRHRCAPAGFSPPWTPLSPAPPAQRNPQWGKNPLPRRVYAPAALRRSRRGRTGSPRTPVRPAAAAALLIAPKPPRGGLIARLLTALGLHRAGLRAGRFAIGPHAAASPRGKVHPESACGSKESLIAPFPF